MEAWDPFARNKMRASVGLSVPSVWGASGVRIPGFLGRRG